MKPYVLDASVAAKWFLRARDETLLPAADRLLQRYVAAEAQFFVPDLFFAEFANILWKAERLGRCGASTTDAALDQIIRRNFPTFAAAPLLRGAAEIARAHARTIYDSLYLALAVDLDAPFVTADEKLVRAIGGRLPVVWLATL